MRYDGGPRLVHPDGSIEIEASPRIRVVPALVAFLATFALGTVWPVLFGIASVVVLLWALALARRSRRADRPGRRGAPARRVVFDASARVLRVIDRGRAGGERSFPFSGIHALVVEQREPRRIAMASPVLAVNGEELLSVKDTLANADLERELQALVGLPLRASPRDRDGIADL